MLLFLFAEIKNREAYYYMNTIDLNGKWQLKSRQAGKTDDIWTEITAKVPGCVELDLMRNNLLPDLSVGNNIYAGLELENNEWRYLKSFVLPLDFPQGKAELVFEGIDCIAEVSLNGQMVGCAANMLIAHRFEVSALLKRNGENLLEVHILPAVAEGRKHEPGVNEFAMRVNWESLSVRKAGHMYGWDIAPRIVSAGLWRGVSLEYCPEQSVRNVYWSTLKVDVENRTAELLCDWDLSIPGGKISQMILAVKLEKDGKQIYSERKNLCSHHGKDIIKLNDVNFWWPKGSGEPHLYDATIILEDDSGRCLDKHSEKIGIRTIELRKTDVTSAAMDGDFSFIVNGQRIFCKGTNWVPLDSLHSRDPEHLERTLDMAVDLNCNMLRCWGGNVYEDHAFFDYCDAAGMMVWQDFALACASYPQDDSFVAQINKEAEFVIKKLRNHSSLALWSGNNEIDQVYQGWGGLIMDPNKVDKISRKVLAEAVERLDPVREYLPSSPYYSPELIERGCGHDMRPEDHLWGPRDNFKGEFYMSSNAHFVSEIGYHGCPDLESMIEMMGTNDIWPWQNNELWLTKAVRSMPEHTDYDYRIPLMASQIEVLFDRAPDNIEDFIFASQASQAEALKFFIEKWRSEKNVRSGILWWNLRDCWPIISDAIVDYYNRKKLAYEHVKTSQTDVCAIVTEAENDIHKLVIVNDTLKPVSGTVELFNVDSDQSLFNGEFTIESNGRLVIGSISKAEQPELWMSRMQLNEAGIQLVNHYISGDYPLKLEQYKKWLQYIEQERSND